MAKKGSERGGIFDLLSWAVGLSDDGENRLELIPLDEITVDKRQPRRYFATESLTQLAQSIRANGVIEQVLVRKLENGKFQLIAGERRWRAAQLAKSQDIPAIITTFVHDSDIKKFQLIENLMREDLNPLEEVFAYLDLIAARINLGPLGKNFLGADLSTRRNRLIELLRKLARAKRERMQPEETIFLETVEAVFKEIGHCHWQDFVKQRLQIVNLPAELLTALNEGWLSYEQARILSRITARNFGATSAVREREKLLAWIKRSSPTMAELRARVTERRATRSVNTPPTVTTRLSQTARRLKTIKQKTELSPKHQVRLEKALANLETLVESIEAENRNTNTKNLSDGKRLK